MQVKEVDPYKVNVDEMNERKENLNITDLEESVKEQGVIQPPIVRERNGDAEVPYSVVVGQRRTLAAQSAGLDTLPVVVMDYDDKEALDASVTENIEAFREDVSPSDRAKAIKRRLEWDDVSTQEELAEKWGVHRKRIVDWMERTRGEWQGTVVDPDFEPAGEKDAGVLQEVEEMSDGAIKEIRQAVGGGEEGEALVERVIEHDLGKHDVREVTDKIEAGRDIDEAVAQTVEEKHTTGGIKVSANVTFSGDHAGALTSYAKDRGMTENEVVREAITDYLEREGYL